MDRQATVFYVDDNPKSRRLLTSLLQARGFAVIAEGDPLEALDRAGSLEFEVALLDYQMPGMMGTQLARGLRRIDPDLPVVVISGLETLPREELVFVDVHLGRGTRLEQLLDTIERLAHQRTPQPGPGAALAPWHEST